MLSVCQSSVSMFEHQDKLWATETRTTVASPRAGAPAGRDQTTLTTKAAPVSPPSSPTTATV